jgi:malonate transporter and related proteins
MQAVLNAALPIFALILTGFLAARFGGFDRAATDALNRFAVYFALPALIFVAMAKVTPDEIGHLGFIGAFAGGIALTFGLGFLLSRARGKRVAAASIEGLDAGYSNTGFMGIPLCLLLFGQESVPPAVIATLFTACVLFIGAIALVEIDLHEGRSVAGLITKVGGSLVRNPLFLAPVAGLAVALGGIPVPGPVERFASILGGAASPCALFCIGLFLAQERAEIADLRPIGTLVALKLLVQPAVTAALAFAVFRMPPLWSHSAVLLSALPIGSGPFTIAKLYDVEAGVTSGAILLSHVASVATVSMLVAWLA